MSYRSGEGGGSTHGLLFRGVGLDLGILVSSRAMCPSFIIPASSAIFNTCKNSSAKALSCLFRSELIRKLRNKLRSVLRDQSRLGSTRSELLQGPLYDDFYFPHLHILAGLMTNDVSTNTCPARGSPGCSSKRCLCSVRPLGLYKSFLGRVPQSEYTGWTVRLQKAPHRPLFERRPLPLHLTS